jgi:fimbrial isopeptide formation D2 family protein/LPXTG-motif cell wall-anchored protein
MKGIKTLLTGVLAATLIMGSTITAFATDAGADASAAAGSNKITIERDTDTYGQGKEVTNSEIDPDSLIQDYTAYKILSVEISGTDSQTYLYYVDNADQKAALVTTGIFNISEAGEGKWYVSLNQEATVDGKKFSEMTADEQGIAVAEKFRAMDKSSFDKKVVQTEDASNAVFDNMSDGYYYIESTLGSNLIVRTVGENITIHEKNKYPTIDKKQKDEDYTGEGYTDDSVNVKVGDVINYQITVSVPAKTSKEIIVTDTMSTGLTLVANSIVVTGYGAGTTAAVDGQTFTVTLPVNTGDATTTTITFDATVNTNAVTEAGKKNEVTLDYGNYHQYDSVPYEIYKTGVLKFDGATEDPLKGAEFTLAAKKGDTLTTLKFTLTDGVYVVDENGSDTLTSNDDGEILVKGIDADKTLVLTETKAPKDYNLLTDPVTIGSEYIVVIDEEDTPMEELFPVANFVGTILPSTGGMGTTIFYIVGAVLIVAGVAYFIVRRKAHAE